MAEGKSLSGSTSWHTGEDNGSAGGEGGRGWARLIYVILRVPNLCVYECVLNLYSVEIFQCILKNCCNPKQNLELKKSKQTRSSRKFPVLALFYLFIYLFFLYFTFWIVLYLYKVYHEKNKTVCTALLFFLDWHLSKQTLSVDTALTREDKLCKN